MNRHAITRPLALLLTAALAATASADGMMLAPDIYTLYESDQLAYLDFDAGSGMEELHILPRFFGDAAEFAWIIPTPSLPELELSDFELFRDLAQLTAEDHRSRDAGWGCDKSYDVSSPGYEGTGLDVYGEELVGIYQALILGADDADTLADSLENWGYLHEQNQAEVRAVLEEYVNEDWCFVALKVDSLGFDDFDPYDYGYYYGYALQPVKLRFAAEAPVYPLRISAPSADHYTSVILYLNDDRRMDLPGAQTHYANRFNADELRALRNLRPALGPRVEEGDFLTKLYLVYYTPESMTADLYPVEADSQDEFRRIYYSGLPLSLALLVGLALGARALGRRRRGA